MLRDMARNWTAQESPVGAFRKLRDSGSAIGFDPTVFADMAAMGWAGVIIPEAYGGSNFGALALGMVLEETARTLTASPLLASALVAASAIMLGGTDAQKQAWLPGLAAGDL
ncbi:MAG: acyl-CoA dehydrogenase family protein, partial [Sandarakinorhabdus sp.]